MHNTLQFEKVRYLYGTLPLILSTHLVATVLFAFIMWQEVDNTALSVWIGISIVLLAFRLYHYLLYTNSSETELREESTLWMHRYYTYVLLGGTLWGSTPLVLFPSHEVLYQMVVVLFVLGITATALGIISASWYLVVAYALLSFAPLIVRLTWMHDPLYQVIAYIVTALGILMIFTAKYFGTIINAALRNKRELIQMHSNMGMMKEQFAFLLENAPVGIVYYNTQLKVTDVNKRMVHNLSLEGKQALIGFDLMQIADKRILPALTSVLQGKEGSYVGPFYSSMLDKSLYIELLSIPLKNAQDDVIGAIAFFSDLTSETEAKETIRQNAFYDPLTKLPNRTLFTDRLELAIEQSRRHRYYCAVLFIDLDHFKEINDNYGHYIGDQVLYRTGQCLLEHVRSEDTVARIGGNEFLVLLNNFSVRKTEAEQIAMNIAKNLANFLHEPFKIDTHSLQYSASIGLYLFNGQRENDSARIIKRSDIAMYEAKRNGRNRVQLYHETFEQSKQEVLRLENELRRAIEREEFLLYFQPKVSMKSDKIEQVEALIRWQHPIKGLIMPDEFIPLAEKTGLILSIGEWVFETALQQIQAWQNDGKAQRIGNIAINVSPSQFHQPDFVDFIKKMLDRYGVEPSMIELELTENVMIDRENGAIDKINALEAMGVKIALDDFGTGYSSLSYLKHLPVSAIKIDRSFITDLRHSKNAYMIVKTIVSIAKSLDMTVIAEGVETEEDLKVLETLDCDYYQGFYCAKALPASQIEMLMDHRNCKHDQRRR